MAQMNSFSEQGKDERIEEVRLSIALAAKLLPFKSKCLPRSIVMADLLSQEQINAVVKIGVRKQSNKLLSHAWVEVDDVVVCEPEVVEERFERLGYD